MGNLTFIIWHPLLPEDATFDLLLHDRNLGGGHGLTEAASLLVGHEHIDTDKIFQIQNSLILPFSLMGLIFYGL